MQKKAVSFFVKVAMFAALSIVLYFISFPLPFFVPFLKVQFSNLPAYIAGFALHPVGGLLVVVIRFLIKIPMSDTGVFEEETEVQVAVIVNETQYFEFYIGAYDGTDNVTGYYAKIFEISGYPSAGETYTTTYTVPSGYGVIVGGWSNKGNVTVKVVKIGV